MASPGELVDTLAAEIGVPRETVGIYDRNLVLAGIRRRGGRGRSALKVTPRDAANLLTAVLASWQVRDAAASVQRYLKTRVDRTGSSKDSYAALRLSELGALPADHSFVDGLEALIASTTEGALRRMMEASGKAFTPMLEVSAQTPGTLGIIRLAGLPSGLTSNVRYTLPIPPRDVRATHQEWKGQIRNRLLAGDMEQSRRVTATTILGIADLLRSRTHE